MSKWDDAGMTDKVHEVLLDHRFDDDDHHFGRTFLTSYQIAIELERRYPGTAALLGKQLGGAGTGEQVSVAQYVANELSKQIKAHAGAHRIEGRFISNLHVSELDYSGPNGTITSSLTGTGFDLALFRIP
jgi:hypothetical protein